MSRRKTDGERIVERLRSHVYVQNDASGHIPAVYIQEVEIARYIDSLIRRRMAEAWDEGNVSPGYLKDNPYRGRKKK